MRRLYYINNINLNNRLYMYFSENKLNILYNNLNSYFFYYSSSCLFICRPECNICNIKYLLNNSLPDLQYDLTMAHSIIPTLINDFIITVTCTITQLFWFQTNMYTILLTFPLWCQAGVVGIYYNKNICYSNKMQKLLQKTSTFLILRHKYS